MLLCYDDVLFLESIEDESIKSFWEMLTSFSQMKYSSKIGEICSTALWNSHIDATDFLSFSVSA